MNIDYDDDHKVSLNPPHRSWDNSAPCEQTKPDELKVERHVNQGRLSCRGQDANVPLKTSREWHSSCNTRETELTKVTEPLGESRVIVQMNKRSGLDELLPVSIDDSQFAAFKMPDDTIAEASRAAEDAQKDHEDESENNLPSRIKEKRVFLQASAQRQPTVDTFETECMPAEEVSESHGGGHPNDQLGNVMPGSSHESGVGSTASLQTAASDAFMEKAVTTPDDMAIGDIGPIVAEGSRDDNDIEGRVGERFHPRAEDVACQLPTKSEVAMHQRLFQACGYVLGLLPVAIILVVVVLLIRRPL